MIRGVMTNEARHAQMAEAIAQGFPMLRKHGKTSDRRISIVCYGPSLKQTWKNIPDSWVMTVSGAHDFLIARGKIPDFHVDCDPRAHKAAMLTNPAPITKYLMASVCHPDFWQRLEGRDVTLWHLINGNDFETPAWIRANHPQGAGSMIGGGSSVGMRALEVCAHMGFRRFDIYGMDCSLADDEHHAGPHAGKPQETENVSVAGRKFKTTPQMLQAAREMERFLLTMDADIRFHGDGLMQATAQHLKHPSNFQKVA